MCRRPYVKYALVLFLQRFAWFEKRKSSERRSPTDGQKLSLSLLTFVTYSRKSKFSFVLIRRKAR